MRHGILSEDPRPPGPVAGKLHCFAGVGTGAVVGFGATLAIGIVLPESGVALLAVPFLAGLVPPLIIGESAYPGDAHALLTGVAATTGLLALLFLTADPTITRLGPESLFGLPLLALGSLFGIRLWRLRAGTARNRIWHFVPATPKESLCDCSGSTSPPTSAHRARERSPSFPKRGLGGVPVGGEEGVECKSV